MSVMDNIFDLTRGNEPRYERKFFISNSTLYEIKSLIKLHPACFKEAFPQRRVNNIYFDSLGLENYLDNKFYLLQLRVSSLNNYFRQYYVSADKKFRLTLDFDLCFCKPEKLIERDNSNCILELKYDYEYDDDARNVSAELPFRMTKSSKHTMGIEKLS